MARRTKADRLLKEWVAKGMVDPDDLPAPPAGTAEWVELPLPPSTNHLFRNVPGVGRAKTTEYKDWLKLAVPLLGRLRPPAVYPCVFRVSVVDGPGLNKARDLDNFWKPIQDAAVEAKVLEADNLTKVVAAEVKLWRANPNTPARPAFVVVRVTEAAEVPTWSLT